jgi:hypothetical protein
VIYGYRKERLELEYPGFSYTCVVHERVDTPTMEMLNACSGHEGSYCSTARGLYFITIDNYLGHCLIVKEIKLDSKPLIDKVIDILELNVNDSSPVRRIAFSSTLFMVTLGFPLLLMLPTVFSIKIELPPSIATPEINIFLPTPSVIPSID